MKHVLLLCGLIVCAGCGEKNEPPPAPAVAPQNAAAAAAAVPSGSIDYPAAAKKLKAQLPKFCSFFPDTLPANAEIIEYDYHADDESIELELLFSLPKADFDTFCKAQPKFIKGSNRLRVNIYDSETESESSLSTFAGDLTVNYSLSYYLTEQ